MPVKEGVRWDLFDLIVRWYYRPRFDWRDLLVVIDFARDWRETNYLYTDISRGKHRMFKIRTERKPRYGF